MTKKTSKRKKPEFEKKANITNKTLREFVRLLSGCNHCDWDEAEGLLMDHCNACCRKVTQYAFTQIQLIVSRQEVKREPQ